MVTTWILEFDSAGTDVFMIIKAFWPFITTESHKSFQEPQNVIFWQGLIIPFITL